MFVFKAAVVGAGVMGGEIAQVIASADVPVLLKDVDQRFVDAGLDKAREVTQRQVAKLVEKGKLTQEQADAQLEHTLGLITGTTDYDAFGDVDFVIEAVCQWCVASAVVMTLLALVSLAGIARASGPAA